MLLIYSWHGPVVLLVESTHFCNRGGGVGWHTESSAVVRSVRGWFMYLRPRQL